MRKSNTAKKGLTLSLHTIIGLVLVAVALIVVWQIIVDLVDVLDSEEKASVNNFHALKDQINSMNVDTKIEYPIYIDPKSYIIGFPKDVSMIDVSSCNRGTADDIIQKPPECGTKPCLCICLTGTQCTKGTLCTTKFDGDFDFDSDVTCDYALIDGQVKPRTIFIHKMKKIVKICREKCW